MPFHVILLYRHGAAEARGAHNSEVTRSKRVAGIHFPIIKYYVVSHNIFHPEQSRHIKYMYKLQLVVSNAKHAACQIRGQKYAPAACQIRGQRAPPEITEKVVSNAKPKHAACQIRGQKYAPWPGPPEIADKVVSNAKPNHAACQIRADMGAAFVWR